MNIQHLFELVGRQTGIQSRKLDEILCSIFIDKCNLYLQKNNFWFTKVIPDASVYASFPITSLTALTNSEGWIAEGWFFTTTGTGVYEIKAPLFKSLHTGESEFDEVFVSERVKNLFEVTKFSVDGANEGQLTVVPPDHINRDISFTTADVGQPTIASLVWTNNKSYIQLHPVPDDTYLYSVSYSIRSFRPIIDMNYTNPLMEFYPEVARMLAAICLFEYSHSYDHMATYYGMLREAEKSMYREAEAHISANRRFNFLDGPNFVALTNSQNGHPTSNGGFYPRL